MTTTHPPEEPQQFTQEPVQGYDPAWHLHDGHMRLYVVGCSRQTKAFFPVTAPDSSTDKHGTPEERATAKKAVDWLRIHQRDNIDAGPAEIREALEKFGWKADEFTKYPV